MVRQIVTCIALLFGGVASADEPVLSDEALTVAELQEYLDDYQVELSTTEIAAVSLLAEKETDQKAKTILRRILEAEKQGVSPELLMEAAQSDLSGYLTTLFASSDDPLISFGMSFRLTKAGNREGAERLIQLMNDESIEPQSKRALNTYFKLFGVTPDIKDADQIVALFKPRDIVSLIGKPAPQFEATTISGDKVSLAEFRGKVVLLHFWATWCGPCMAQMPDLKSELSEFSDDQIVSLFVSMDVDEASLREAVTEHQLPGHQILSDAGVRGAITSAYSIRSFPSDVVIDQDGVVRSYSWRDLTKYVR